MNSKITYVVGNKFENISDNKKILSFNEFLKRNTQNTGDKEVISFEQGISEEQILSYKNKFKNNVVKISDYFEYKQRCPEKLTHKAKNYNTLISDPEKIEEGIFKSLLVIDERCAELSDHVTGKHIQFMVLVEAGRQMVNAVTEKFYSDNSKIYLAKNINVEFKNFVYPFKTEMFYRVTGQKIKVGGNGEMSIEINFMQWGKLASKFHMDFTLLDRNFVTTLEDKSIKSMIGE